nr:MULTISPECIES: DUF3263 domain-containing protein [unclassified Frankia]
MAVAHVLAPESETLGPPPHPIEVPAAEPRGSVDSPVSAHAAQTDTKRDTVDALSDRQRQILEFERHWWRYAGAKETAIRAEFTISATRYYQILNALIDSPAALVADPMLVKRLRRLRATRRRARAGGTARLDPAEM